MLTISPFSKLKIFISEKKDGSIDSPKQAFELLQQYQTNLSICYFHHLHQVDRHHCLQRPKKKIEEVWADAAITNQKTCLAMKVADCFPIVLTSQTTPVVALIHAGWKPLLQNIIKLTLLDLQLRHNLLPGNVKAWIGPGIHSCCYRFKEKPIQADWHSWQSAIKKINNTWTIDLSQYIIHELSQAGVKKNYIINFDQCTGCQSDSFFSHFQANQSDSISGRMLVAAKLM